MRGAPSQAETALKMAAVLPRCFPSQFHGIASDKGNGNDTVFAMGYLVGAAGFEPTTCSTQNCRATRLRYTPIIARKRRRYTLKADAARRRKTFTGR
jgi:hypothetical protein